MGYICRLGVSYLLLYLLQVEWMAMNDGDVYVLDTKSIIYVWTGRNSNNVEKLQGAKVCMCVRYMYYVVL